MKRLLLFVMLICGIYAYADRLIISNLYDTESDGVKFFTVSLEGETIYNGYQIYLTMPDGYSCTSVMQALEEDFGEPDIYPYQEKKNPMTGKVTKTLACSFTYSDLSKRKIGIGCIPTSNINFSATSGVLFYVMIERNATELGPYSIPQLKVSDAIMVKPIEGQTDIEDFSKTIITQSWSATCTLNVSQANQYSTCILPFSAPIPTGLKAFSARGTEDGAVALEEASEFAAYTPYILYAAQGYSGTVSGTVDPANYVDSATDGLLVGAIQPLDATSGYVMQNQGQGVKFYQIKQGDHYSINSGKCYLNIPESHSPMFDLDASLTSVTSAQTVETESCDYRDLQGRLMTVPVVGQMYIKGSKTYLKVK